MRFLLTALLLIAAPFSFAVERIISLAPSSTELIYAAGLADKLIAVSDFSDYPQEAKQLERVASFQSVNIERIIALNPDLIVAWRSGGVSKSLTQLEQLGYKIYYSDTDKLSDIAVRLEELSQYADNPDIGKLNAQKFRDKLAQLDKKFRDRTKVRYFYQLSSKPIYTIAQSHWPSEVFSLCGGINIFKQSPNPYPQVGLEQVLVRKPEAIFTSSHTTQNPEMWDKWRAQLPAVQSNNIWSLNSDWLNRPTPRSLMAIEEVCDRFDQVRAKNQK